MKSLWFKNADGVYSTDEESGIKDITDVLELILEGL